MNPIDPNSLTDRQLLLLTYEKVDGMDKRLDSHGKRLKSLETWKSIIVGGSIVVGALWKLIADRIEKAGG